MDADWPMQGLTTVRVTWMAGTMSVDWDRMPFDVLVDGVRCGRVSELKRAIDALTAQTPRAR